MTTYAFETITPTQALAIQASDSLSFAAGPARGVGVAYNIPIVGPATVTLTFEGRSVEFGLNLLEVSEQGRLTFPDDSRLMIGGTGNDGLLGWVHDDALFGGAGDDNLQGQGGDDVLQGNQGNDRLSTEHGADVVYGGQGDDVIRTGVGVAGEAGDFANGNMGNDTITGGAGNDVLLGGRDHDQINGGLGDDYLSGDLGNDELRGGQGADSLFGGAGDDILYSGGGKDLISGGDGADQIIVYGGGGATVDGDDGDDDILSASAAKDVLLGGAGADLFEFLSYQRPAEGQDDEIRDWGRSDKLAFEQMSVHAPTPADYAEVTAGDYSGALALANLLIAQGKAYVAAQVGGDVVVFADTDGVTANGADIAVVLAGRTLDNIDAGAFL